MNHKRLFAPIAKVEEQADGTVKVFGFASTEARDSQGEIILADAMKTALPAYLEFGAVREMHQQKAAGTAIEADVRDDGKTWFGAHVVDSEAVKKVRKKVYKGFSIGGQVTSRAAEDPTTITGLDLIEVSLVDRPANPEAVITVMKRDAVPPKEGAEMLTTNEAILEKAKELAKAQGKDDPGDFLDPARDALEKAAPSGAVFVSGDAADPDAALKAARAKVKQVHQATDGKTFATKDEAAKHEAGLAGRDPEADAALAVAKAALAKATFGESTNPTSGVTAYDLEGSTARPRAAADVEEPAHDTVEANRQANVSTPALAAQDKEKGGAQPKDGEPDKMAPDESDHAKAAAHHEKAFAFHKRAMDKAKDDGDDKEAARHKALMDHHEKKAEEHREKAKADKAAKADKKPYGDVEYADPGYQKDEKKRYPVDTEEHIRAAWNYINKPKNGKKYSPEQVKSIKAKIVAAWKAKIDKDGPPSASEDKDKKKAAISAQLAKGMQEVARLACLVQELEWLHQCVEMEEAYEEDVDSEEPAELKECIVRLCAALRSMVDEETEELLNDEEMEDFGELLELAASGLKPGDAAALHKVVAGARLAKADDGVLARLPMLKGVLAKVGRRHNRGDMEKIQAMHDHSVSLGAKCDASNGDIGKAALPATLEVGALKAQLGEMSATMTQLSALVQKMAEQPAVVPPSRLSVVDKSADAIRDFVTLAENSPTAIAGQLIKAAFKSPLTLNRSE